MYHGIVTRRSALPDPAYPHSPLLVAVDSCDAIVLRWRGFETLLWPVERFVLERYPDRDDQSRWSTLVVGNLSEVVDVEVRPGRKYTYRIRAISRGNVSSAYDYQWVQAPDAHRRTLHLCHSSATVVGAVGGLNVEGLHSLGLLFACFLTVYSLVRANVMGVQGTQSRTCRLKRIQDCASEKEALTGRLSTGPAVSMLQRRSSILTSTSSRSIDGTFSQRDSIFDTNASATMARAEGTPRAESHGSAEPSRRAPASSAFRAVPCATRAMKAKVTACQHCGKRFGLFRKHHLCDICHSVSLCRKCGFQASVDSFANAHSGVQRTANGSRDSRAIGQRHISISRKQQKKLKIRTICKSCCNDRYATSPTRASP